MAPRKGGGNSGIVLKWLIPVRLDRLRLPRTGAFLDLLPCPDYFAWETNSLSRMLQLKDCRVMLTKFVRTATSSHPSPPPCSGCPLIIFPPVKAVAAP